MLPASMVHAQTRLDQRWSAGSNTIADRPVFSRNGAFVLLKSEGDYKIGRVSDGSIIASLGVSNPQGAAFSGNSSQAYVANGGKVLVYRVLDGFYQSVLLTDPNLVVQMTTSRDGKYLVYVSYNPGAGTAELVNYDVLLGAEVFRKPLPAVPSNVYVSYDITKIIVDGPDVYSVTTGDLLLDTSSQAGPFAISRYGDFAYGRSAADPTKLESRRTSDGSLQWTNAFPVTGYTGGAIQATGNGDRILIAGRDSGTGKPKVWVIRPGNGTVATTAMPGVRTDLSANLADNVTISASPNTFDLVLTQRVTPASGDPFVVNEGFTLGATSTFDAYRDLSSISYDVSAIATTPNSVPSVEAPVVALGGVSGGSSVGGIQLRNETTGQIIKSFPGFSVVAGRPDALAINNDASAVVFTQPGVGMTALDTATGAVLGTLNVNAYSYEFTSNNHFWASLSDNTLRKYEITGVGIVQIASIASVPASNQLTINPVGELAAVLGPDVRQFTRVELATGNKRVQAVANAGGANKYLKFTNDGLLYVGWENPSNFLAIRSYNVSGATNVPIRTYSRQVVAAYERSIFGVSNDGKMISVGNSRWAATGTDDRVVGDIWVFSSVTASLLLSYRDQQLGSGLNAFLPTADGAGAIWSRQDPGALMVKYVPVIESLAIAPTSVVGGNGSTGTVTLTAPANASGIVVALSSSAAEGTVPATVTIPNGASSATFTLATTAVTALTDGMVTATYNLTSVQGPYQIKPNAPKTVTFSANKVWAGTSVTGTVTLQAPAKAGGEVVTLTGSSANATLPATVTVPAGATTANFTVNVITAVTAEESYSVTASLGGETAVGSFDLRFAGIASYTLSRTSAQGGNSVVSTVTLTAPAPAGGLVVTFSTSNTAVARAASNTITIPAGQTTGNVTITTSVVAVNTAVTLTASRDGSSKSAVLNVAKPR